MSAVDVRSDKLGRLVDENVEVKQLGTGFTFTEGPIWHPKEQFLLFSDMPGDMRRRWDDADGRSSRSSRAREQVQRDDATTPTCNLLVCEHVDELARPRGPGRQTRASARLALRGPGAEQPERRLRPLGRRRSTSPTRGTGACRLRHRARAACSAARASSASRPAAATPSSSSTSDEYEQPNGLCFSPGRVAALHQRHAGALIKVYDVERRRHPRQRPHVLRGRRLRRDRGGHPGRDEVRRAREHLGHGPGRRLGDQLRGRAPRRDPGPGEHRQPRPGAATDWHTLFIPSSTSLYAIKTNVGPRREPYMR